MYEMEELKAGIAELKAAREAAYAAITSDLTSDLSKLGMERKMTAYKLNSAIKYESHVSAKKHAELQAQVSALMSVEEKD